MYFVNHLLVVCFHWRRSLTYFSCNRCLVQCVSSGVEFDDNDDADDDGQDASEDDGDHDDDNIGGDFDDGQDFIGSSDVWRHYHIYFMFFFFMQ